MKENMSGEGNSSPEGETNVRPVSVTELGDLTRRGYGTAVAERVETQDQGLNDAEERLRQLNRTPEPPPPQPPVGGPIEQPPGSPPIDVNVVDYSEDAVNALGQSLRQAMAAQRIAEVQEMRRIAQEDDQKEIDQDHMKYEVETEYGTKKVTWNKDVRAGIQDMRKILIGIETSPEEGGGRAKQLELQRLVLIMDHLQKSKEDSVKKVGEEMYQEFMFRYSLQSSFLKFIRAGGTDDGAQVSLGFTRDYLNFIFKQGDKLDLPILRFIQEYDARALEYLKKGSDDKLSEFNQELINKIGQEYAAKGRKLTVDDLQSAQISGERVWQMLGRMISHDKLIDKSTREIVDEEYVKNKLNFDIAAAKANLADNDPRKNWKLADWIMDLGSKGVTLPDFDFLGNASANGANFAFRKVLDFPLWVLSRIKADKPYLDVAKGTDIGSVDGFGGVPGMVKDYFQGILSDKYDTEKAEKLAIKVATLLIGEKNIAKGYNPQEGDPNKQFTYDKKGKIDFGWKKGLEFDITQLNPTGEGRLDQIKQILGDDYQLFCSKVGEFIGIDFNQTRSSSPLVVWVFISMGGPEKAKAALMDDPDGFFRHPTKENLFKLGNLFAYKGEGQYETKTGLLERGINFARTKYRLLGRHNLNFEEAYGAFKEALDKRFITEDQYNPSETKIFGRFARLRVRFGFMFNFWEFLKGIGAKIKEEGLKPPA